MSTYVLTLMACRSNHNPGALFRSRRLLRKDVRSGGGAEPTVHSVCFILKEFTITCPKVEQAASPCDLRKMRSFF